jgi:hypothetical protein
LDLDERHDRHLVLSEPIVRRWLGRADRLSDHAQQLDRDPRAIADLAERLGRERREPLVALSVEERQGQGAPGQPIGHGIERDPCVLEGSRHDRAADIAGRPAIGRSGADEAEIDQPVQERRLDARARGGFGPIVRGHVANPTVGQRRPSPAVM